MAVTKTHPIKRALKAAIDYICNPEKTDGKLLVSAYGCAAETADIEFSWTRRHAIDKGTNLGRHLIFNAVSFADHKHYHSNKRSYHFIRRTSDRICKEHGLSVIVPGQGKGKSYIEHQAERTGTSYKAKLRAAIDRLLPDCHDLEELLVRLQREGYELKRGKYISARAPGQERFTRLKTLGADYAEDALTARMAGRARPSRQPKHQSGKISLLIDIQNNIKAQQSAGYRHWATIENLKRIAETSNFLTEHGIGSMEELTERCEAASASAARLKNEDANDFEGGEPHDKRRGLKRLFPQDHPTGGVGRAAVLPADGRRCVYHHRGLGPRYGNVENGRFADGKAIHRLMEKDRPFPQDGKPLSHSAARLGRLPTVPQRLRLLLPQKSRSFIEKIIISW